jgi:uncharacterized membrane protein YfcA
VVGAGALFFVTYFAMSLAKEDGTNFDVALPIILGAPLVGAIAGAKIGSDIPKHEMLYERKNHE